MTERSSIRDSRLASFARQDASGDDSSGGSHLLALGGFVALLLSATGSVIAYGMLPDQIRIHWTLGMGPYYGPEFAPALLVLTVFPVVIAATSVSAYLGATQLNHSEESTPIRVCYVVTVFGALIALLGTQAGLIVANL